MNSNSIYGIQNPVGLKYLTRLRVDLSHLRSHMYHRNFTDTTSKFCFCYNNTPETVAYYLLYCHLKRLELFEKLKHITSLITLISSSYSRNLLLFCNSSYDSHTNRKLLELTTSFITSSNRFEGPFTSKDWK